MNVILKTIDNISKWSGRIVSPFIILVMLILFYETVMRYVFSSPTTWAHHISSNLMVFFFLIGGAYTLLHNGHVNMDIVYNLFSPRVKAILDIITATLFYAFLLILLVEGFEYAMRSINMTETSGPPLFFPLYPVKAVVPVAALLITLQGTAKLIRDFTIAIKGEAK